MPTVGPGTSARMTCIEELSVLGIMAMTKTRMPMPPIQWVKLRQKSRLLGSTSTLRRQVEPVVVKPETVSKKASKRFDIWPLSTNGRAPKSDISIHESATIT